MSKRKTVLKFAIAAVLLGGSSAVAVLYFPYVALAIKFGIVVSTAPLAIFAISAIFALASVITLGVLAVSALRSNSKSNEVDEELRSKNEEEGKNLVQEKEQAVPTPMPELLPQEPEELVTPAQQQPGDNLVEETETPQHEQDTNFVVEKVASTEQTSLPSVPPYPEQTFPMNNLESLPLPNPQSGEYNSLRNANLLPNPSQQTIVKVLYDSLPPSPSIELLNSFDQSQPFPSLPSIVVDGHNGSEDSSHSVKNHGLQNEEWVFYPDEAPSLSSSISSLYGSHYSTSSDPSSSSGSTPSLSSLNSSSSSSVSSDCSNSSYDQQSSLPIAAKLKAALAERAQQHNQTGFVVEQGYYNSATGQALNSMDAAHMSMIRDDFNSYFSSIAPRSGLSLNNVYGIIRHRQDHHNGSDLSSSMYCASTSAKHRVAPSYLPDNALQGIGADPNTINYSAQDYESLNYPALVPTYHTSSRSAAQHDNGAVKSLPLNDSGPKGMLSGVHPVKSSDFKSI